MEIREKYIHMTKTINLFTDDENNVNAVLPMHCSQMSTILFSIVTQDSDSTILLTPMSNDKKLFNPVILQAQFFFHT